MNKDQQTIFITGSAGGMGLATGRYFAERGWFVGLFDIDDQALEKAAKTLPAGAVMARRLDVTSEEDFTAAVAAFGEHTGGRMDVLYNNAGIAPGAWFEDMPMATIRRIIDINVFGVIIGIRAALPLLKNTKDSLCVSTSSSCATYGHGFRAVYAASKFAVKGLTESLSLEFERFGIRTADVLPGCIDTPMLRGALAASQGRPFEPSMFDGMAKTGPYRLMPDTAIAEAVWGAYNTRGQVHWYVPEEVGDIDRLKATDFAAAREETRLFTLGGR